MYFVAYCTFYNKIVSTKSLRKGFSMQVNERVKYGVVKALPTWKSLNFSVCKVEGFFQSVSVKRGWYEVSSDLI